MAHVSADRVRDTSTSTGTGAFVVSGTAPTAFRTFSAVLSTSDTFYYAIQHQTANEWEVGLGTYSSANTITRTTVYASSASGSAVTFSSGTKDVFITLAAARSVQLDNNGAIPGITDAGDLTFTGTGRRITGDMSNATVANRLMFQTSTTNGNTGVSALPNGTSVTGTFQAYGNSDPANASFLDLACIGGTDGRISSAIRGTGTYLPMTFYTGGSERMRVATDGNVGISTSSPATKLSVGGSSQNTIRVNGTSTADQAPVFSWFRSGAIETVAYNSSTGWGVAQNPSSYSDANLTSATSLFVTNAGNVGVGTASPTQKLDVYGGAGAAVSLVRAASGQNAFFSVIGNGNSFLSTSFDMVQDSSSAASLVQRANGPLYFSTNNTERMRIDSSGNLLVGKTSTSLATAGVAIESSGVVGIGVGSTTPLFINRQTDDGTLVDFRQANTTEGTISVSGSTVSYNGGHLARWSQLLTDQRDPALLKGTVLSNLDEMCVWLDAEGNPLANEQLNKMKISDVEGDVNVAGVFVNWDNDDQTYTYDMNVAMTGDMIIRIAQGVVIQKGDLLMSAGNGTAKPQGDDIVRGKTIAKVTSTHVTCTYADGSYCVPCVLMAC
jgi:hypothetical protein